MWKTIYEAMAVGVAGLILALLANGMSPQGIRLTRDYFPDAPAAGIEPGQSAPGMAAKPRLIEDVETRLQRRGLEAIGLEEVRAWLDDPLHEMELVILVDARNRRQYEEGHVPGAYWLDHYRPEEGLVELMPVALGAELVIVYCGGGECEDSEFAAMFLRDAGVPGDRLRVYTGGLDEWRSAELPMEIGGRQSGMLR
jgi:rhodanese-related sulfurtransferase